MCFFCACFKSSATLAFIPLLYNFTCFPQREHNLFSDCQGSFAFQSCKASLVISLFSYFCFIFFQSSSIIRILKIASLPKYIPVVVYQRSSSFIITCLILTSILSSNLNKNRIRSCSVYGKAGSFR